MHIIFLKLEFMSQITQQKYNEDILTQASALELPFRNLIFIDNSELALLSGDAVILDVDLTTLDKTPRWIHDGPTGRFARATIARIESKIQEGGIDQQQQDVLETLVKSYDAYFKLEHEVYHSKSKLTEESILDFFDEHYNQCKSSPDDMESFESNTTTHIKDFFIRELSIEIGNGPASSFAKYLNSKKSVIELRLEEGKAVELFHELSLLSLKEKNIHAIPAKDENPESFFNYLRECLKYNIEPPSWGMIWAPLSRHAGRTSEEISKGISADILSLSEGVFIDPELLEDKAAKVVSDNVKCFSSKINLVPHITKIIEDVLDKKADSTCCSASPRDVIKPLLTNLKLSNGTSIWNAFKTETRVYDANKKDGDGYSGRPVRLATRKLGVHPRKAIMLGDGAVDYISSARTSYNGEKVGVGVVLLRIPTCPVVEHPDDWENKFISELLELRSFHVDSEYPWYENCDPECTDTYGTSPTVVIVKDYDSVKFIGKTSGEEPASVCVVRKDEYYRQLSRAS